MQELSIFFGSEFAIFLGVFLTAICLITWAVCGLADYLDPEDWGVSDEEESDYGDEPLDDIIRNNFRS